MKKILLVKLDSVGDVVWSTPLLTTLRRNLPQAFLAMVVRPYTYGVVEGNPHLDQIFLYQDEKLKELVAELRKVNFDIALVIDTTDRANRLAWLSRARERIGYFYRDKPVTRIRSMIYLTRRLVHPAHANKSEGKPHEVEVMFRLLDYLNLKKEIDDELYIPLSDEDEQFASEFLKKIDTGNIIGFHLSYKWFWDKVNWEDMRCLLGRIMKEFIQYHIIITYGPQELSLASQLYKKINDPRITIIGDISIKKWAAIMKRCRVVVSMDTGAIHVASAMKIPVVTVFERHKRLQYERWIPWKIPFRCIFKQFKKEDLKKVDREEYETRKRRLIEEIMEGLNFLIYERNIQE